MLRIGCHLSSSKGFLAMAKTAESIGAATFQFFTRNPRGGAAKEWLSEDIRAMLEYFEKAGIAKPLAHAPYTLNACAKEERTREFLQLMTLEEKAELKPQLELIIESLRSRTPIVIAMEQITQDITLGAIGALLVAPFVRKWK